MLSVTLDWVEKAACSQSGLAGKPSKRREGTLASCFSQPSLSARGGGVISTMFSAQGEMEDGIGSHWLFIGKAEGRYFQILVNLGKYSSFTF